MISIPKRPQWLLTGRGTWIGRPMQTPLIWPKDIPGAARFAIRHPGQAKREPGSHKGRRFNVLRSRIRLRLSGMTAAIWRTLLTRRASDVLPSRKRGSPGFTLMGNGRRAGDSSGSSPRSWRRFVITALTRAREATLQQDFKTMRKLIDDYYGDKGAFPPSLQVLVSQGLSAPSRAIRSTAIRRNGKRFSRRRAASRMCAPFRRARRQWNALCRLVMMRTLRAVSGSGVDSSRRVGL